VHQCTWLVCTAHALPASRTKALNGMFDLYNPETTNMSLP
jgi:hypothetical protein